MKTTINHIVAVLFSVCLSACAGIADVQKETVKDIQTQLVTFPEPLLEPCPVTTPPNHNDYINTMNDQQRLETMVNYSIDLIGDLAKCNNRLVQIRDLQNKQRQIYHSTSENR